MSVATFGFCFRLHQYAIFSDQTCWQMHLVQILLTLLLLIYRLFPLTWFLRKCFWWRFLGHFVFFWILSSLLCLIYSILVITIGLNKHKMIVLSSLGFLKVLVSTTRRRESYFSIVDVWNTFILYWKMLCRLLMSILHCLFWVLILDSNLTHKWRARLWVLKWGRSSFMLGKAVIGI